MNKSEDFHLYSLTVFCNNWWSQLMRVQIVCVELTSRQWTQLCQAVSIFHCFSSLQAVSTAARGRRINKTGQTKPGCLYKHPWHIFTFTESICKHASLLQCLFCLSGPFTPLLIPLSIYHHLLSSSRGSWPCHNETPAHLQACAKSTLNWHRLSKNCSSQT